MLEELRKKLGSEGKIRFKVKIIPKSQKSEIVGLFGTDTLKIKISAIAAKNKANEELVDFLSETFDVSKSQIEIVSGHTSPIKIIEIKR